MRAFRRHALAALLGAASVTATAEVELPAIGSPVDQVLSPREEAAIGAELMAQARRQLPLNRDPEISGYIDGLGRRLTAGVEGAPPDGFTFFVVHDAGINAFAAPGGYIGIHSGLFLAAATEAQLAGVMAHEIAHVTQRHIAKSIAASQRNQYKTLAAVLAGMLLGGSNPQAAQAAIASGVAAEAQRQVNYTRANEYEADRIGIGILARAGYDPQGMTGMFELLMQRAGGSANAAPEFLRTHPLSANRIAEAESRAARMNVPDPRRDTLEFHLMQRRLAVVDASEPNVLRERWQAEDPAGGPYAEAARAYGLALLEIRSGDPGGAIERLRPLYDKAQENLHYGLALARAYRAAGELDAALRVWDHLRAIHPGAFAVIDTGATLLTEAGRPREAVDEITAYLRRAESPDVVAWRRLAEAAEAADLALRSHEALGEYYLRTRQLDRARRQFELALGEAVSGSPDALRIEARLEQVRERQRERMAGSPLGGQ